MMLPMTLLMTMLTTIEMMQTSGETKSAMIATIAHETIGPM